jgi:mono/diheme cytochrome c family protein
MPRFIVPTLAILGALGLIPLAVLARARSAKTNSPRLHVVFDMDQQGKYKPQQANPAFADGRAMRTPVPGTVARGDLHEDTWYYEGKVEGKWATDFPMPVTMDLLKRGRQRFAIYCAPCHGLDGYGDGIVDKRATALEEGTWVKPTDYHTDEIRGRAVGNIFNTITHGVRNMPAYGPQIPPADRWAIISYVRALQKSQNARVKDVPPEYRDHLR